VREELAEQLLGNILEWDTETAKDEIANIRYLAAVKYDGYRNFEPGYRFMESLALWLRNFNSVEERQVAYDFMKSRMLYISDTQMNHLVGLLYPQRVVPILLEQVRQKENMPRFQIRKIRTSITFQILRRKTLFFALSDGARMDTFRRKHSLNNEQVCVSYELGEPKLDRLQKDLQEWIQSKGYTTDPVFENIFLIDDFSGSGNSILRLNKGTLGGKLFKFFTEALGRDKKLGKYCKENGPNIFVVTYIATDTAMQNLRKNVDILKTLMKNGEFKECVILEPLQLLTNQLTVPQAGNAIDAAFEQLLIDYYDNRLEDEYTKTGGPDVIHGYAECRLPLVLCHNCPNNSVYPLWGQTEKSDGRPGLNALFPRISRHLESRT